MAKLMNIGFGNMVNTDKIVCIVSSDSAPAKRMVQKGKEQDSLRPVVAQISDPGDKFLEVGADRLEAQKLRLFQEFLTFS